MNVILGFGKTEEDFENQEFEFVENFIRERADNFVGDKYDFNFDDELIKELTDKLKERKEHYDKLRDKYKEATEYPDRYTTYYFSVLTDKFANLCVVFHFSHINRRHALSPDGWAMIGVKKVYYADAWDFRN
jgi:hypothetical protein